MAFRHNREHKTLVLTYFPKAFYAVVTSMKAWIPIKICDPSVTLYPSPSKSSQPICEITDQPQGEMTTASGGFVRVKLGNGRSGFVDGDVGIHAIQEMLTRQDTTPLFDSPKISSSEVTRLAKETRFSTCDRAVEGDGFKWLPVVTSQGQRGYIRGDVQVLVVPPNPRIQRERSDALKEMLIGGIICGIGTVVTVASYSAASTGGGSYIVAWGAILFGGIQFLRGLFHAASIESDETPTNT